ncbi:four helix bundle protein [Patescibacteria group bacterium]|nr:four helix bundle protein [Patescibacteria group bacterium]MBU4512575.1 four helix bundle protein [Patescibacteria group bacterium]MCG2692812.1 four helix bundle protein [Candidatus Parcubacteria bacterium]
MEKKFIPLKNLEVYKLSRELSKIGWDIYESLNWQDKKIMGDQFIRATDSVGANIAEGYGRFHFLDRIRFYYNSRGSLNEAITHWLELLNERGKVDEARCKQMKNIANRLSLKLNNFISSTYKTKNDNKSQ